MRGKGKGQQFDRLWVEFNDLFELSMKAYTKDDCGKAQGKLCNLKDRVEKKQPISDYEIKDKNNLLSMINKTLKNLDYQLLSINVIEQQESEI